MEDLEISGERREEVGGEGVRLSTHRRNHVTHSRDHTRER